MSPPPPLPPNILRLLYCCLVLPYLSLHHQLFIDGNSKRGEGKGVEERERERERERETETETETETERQREEVSGERERREGE